MKTMGAVLSAMLAMVATTMAAAQGRVVETQRLFLSGHGPDDAVPWDFTIDGDRRAGEKATIPVPSNWQQHGFGAYQYGNEHPERRKNTGHYSRHFTVPMAWKGQRVRLMFDGVMTDTRVRVNGISAGPIHQGGFYRFGFDVTKLIKTGGDNLVEVDVAEASANDDTNRAERFADYWVFGGIFRPVWLEATPQQAIDHVAIDAQSDGALTADVTLAAPRDVTRVEGQVIDRDGRPFGQPFAVAVPPGGTGRVRLSTRITAPRLWTAETPNLYTLTVTLYRGETEIHRTATRFGFRTFMVRPGLGLYLNGQRILLKGVNRHSFRPDTGRALTVADNYADVRLIRSMNMNAVRMSHYPPDEAFLEACDELGLYVLDELSGWQHAHDTEVGRRLVREMIERDVNHPSILFWDNGNEGGWNREIDGDFAFSDPQDRKVLHPWELHDGIDTKHYPSFAEVAKRLAGPDLFMPTEFMHGLFDGGAGAGLEDYWRAIAGSPRGAGGFIWVFADEGIARTDRGGRIDSFASNAPDGIVGPRHEKEPSYFTVRDIWSPVQIAPPTLNAGFTGALSVTNGYDFTSLDQVRFDWGLIRFAKPGDRSPSPKVLRAGQRIGPALAPHAVGALSLPLPADWREADALSVSARRGDEEVWSWTWPIPASPARPIAGRALGTPIVRRTADSVSLSVGNVTARFDAATGLLRGLTHLGDSLALAEGPRLVVARPSTKDEPRWTPGTASDDGVFRPATPVMANIVEVDLRRNPGDSWTQATLAISDGRRWRTISTGPRGGDGGNRFTFPPTAVAAIRITDPRGSGDQPVAVASVRLGYEASRFPTPSMPVTIRTGSARDPATGAATAWLEAPGAGRLDTVRWTLHADGTLGLDYSYRLTGSFLYHGISFDADLAAIGTARALIEGPTPAWQNRRRGTVLGVHDIAARAAADLPVAEHAGYFAGLRWVRLNGANGDWVVTSDTPDILRLGTRLDDFPTTTVDFPPGDVSVLKAMPAMGSKFIAAENSGPAGTPARASGAYAGHLTFAWAPTPAKAGKARRR